MTRDGTGQQPLLRPRTRSLNPSWFPDGQLIAFLGWNDKNLYVVSPNGRDRRRLAGRADTLRAELGTRRSRDRVPSGAPRCRGTYRSSAQTAPDCGGWAAATIRAGRPIRRWSLSTTSTTGGCDCIHVVGADRRGPRRLAEGASPAWQPRPG